MKQEPTVVSPPVSLSTTSIPIPCTTTVVSATSESKYTTSIPSITTSIPTPVVHDPGPVVVAAATQQTIASSPVPEVPTVVAPPADKLDRKRPKPKSRNKKSQKVRVLCRDACIWMKLLSSFGSCTLWLDFVSFFTASPSWIEKRSRPMETSRWSATHKRRAAG